MSTAHGSYELRERHKRYARDTNTFLKELVPASGQACSANRWEFTTKSSVDIPATAIYLRERANNLRGCL
jgi:hypothetical protein